MSERIGSFAVSFGNRDAQNCELSLWLIEGEVSLERLTDEPPSIKRKPIFRFTGFDILLKRCSTRGRPREAFINEKCQHDAGLKADVVKMLRLDSLDDTLFDQPLGISDDASSEPDSFPDHELIELIGEGGMGTVWLAKQLAPVTRQVALKVMRPDLVNKSTVARFEIERQAIGLMNHRHIANVLGGGVSSNGLPFFTMDFVQGLPITQFCDQQQLSLQERLRLFIKVCAAIQHAHQKGVLHRDLQARQYCLLYRRRRADGQGD